MSQSSSSLQQAIEDMNKDFDEYQQLYKNHIDQLNDILDQALEETEEDQLEQELLQDGLLNDIDEYNASSTRTFIVAHTSLDQWKKTISTLTTSQFDHLHYVYQELCSEYSDAYLSGCDWYVGSLKHIVPDSLFETLKSHPFLNLTMFGALSI